ncbi:MAG: 4-hydroxy-tetrahydrodipicolinate reductase [Anaeroplasmataceae bacterium]
MKVLICGIKGKMGSAIYNELSKNPLYEITGFDKKKSKGVKSNLMEALNGIDIVVDFTNYDISKIIIKEALNRKIKVISGTTGFKRDEIDEFYNIALKNSTCFYWSPNYSKGYNIILDETKRLYQSFDKCDIIEVHSNQKLDKPSGTSVAIATTMDFDAQKINSIRLNNALALHSIILEDDDERVIITHEIISRKAFLNGFINAFKKIIGGDYVRETI